MIGAVAAVFWRGGGGGGGGYKQAEVLLWKAGRLRVPIKIQGLALLRSRLNICLDGSATGDSQVERKCEQNGKNSRFNGWISATLESSSRDFANG